MILYTGGTRADPIARLLIGTIIFSESVRVLREAGYLFNERASKGAANDYVAGTFAAIPGAIGVHDTHAWVVDPSYRLS